MNKSNGLNPRQKRILFINKKTKEPEYMALDLASAAYFLGVSRETISFACRNMTHPNVANQLKKLNTCPYSLVYADDYEREHHVAYKYGGINL